jgi:surface polysaccharide O-acyltransferase-like enzyme
VSLSIIIICAILLSIAFHFVGVYAGAKKTVWVMLILMWAAFISLATSEVKPKAYEDLKEIKGKYSDTDALIKESMPKISVYEMLLIRKSFINNESKLKK